MVMTMRLAAVLGCSALLLAVALGAHAEAPAPDHPLVGAWKWTRQANDCTEIYDFRADGTSSAISGEELTEHTYEVSAEPGTNGFYKVDITTVKSNSKQDCSDGQPSDTTGVTHTVYVVFHRNEPLIMMCRMPNLEECFGPLQRTEAATKT